jgi:hypothetical protein
MSHAATVFTTTFVVGVVIVAKSAQTPTTSFFLACLSEPGVPSLGRAIRFVIADDAPVA